MESFFARLKVESIYAEYLKGKRDAYSCVFEYIEMFYNTIRRHSTNCYLSPNDYENNYYEKYARSSVYFSWVTPAPQGSNSCAEEK